MTDNANPFAQLNNLQDGYPPEPFRDLPRRPNGYRDKPEYKAWQQGVRDQHARILCWYQDQLRLVAPGPKALLLELAGRPIPGHDFRVLADGSVRLDCEYAAKMYPDHEPAAMPAGWTRPLEIPGPGANTGKFMNSNASRNNACKVWNLTDRIAAAAPPSCFDPYYAHRLPGMDLQPVRGYINECLDQFVDQLRQLLDPEPFQLLNRLHGSPPTHYWTLLEYNLAVLCRDQLEAAAKVNPGAVACWLNHWHENITPPPRYYAPENAPPKPKHPSEFPPRLPNHPGEIISVVKALFNQSGGKGWKAFARQPAAHFHRQLHRSRSHPCRIHTDLTNWDIALWLNERVHEANLPGLQAKTAAARTPEPAAIPAIPEPAAAAQPANGLRQLSLLDAANGAAPLQPAVSKAQHNRNGKHPAAARTPEPSLYLKLMLPELRFARSAPGADRNQRRAMLGMDAQGAMATAPTAERETATAAIDHLATLALRHFAGSPELKPKSQERKELFAHLQDITDYCWAEPGAAIQARTFAGLSKASHRWHHEHLLREIAAELEAQRIADATPWQTPCPLPFYDEPGWQARNRACRADLQQESVIMRHCVGSGRYQRDSEYGDCRIYHLQPKPARAKPDWKPDDVQARHHGSTVMLANRSLPGQPIQWEPSQHRGHYNRPPTEAEEQFAQRLAAALNNAEAMATPMPA